MNNSFLCPEIAHNNTERHKGLLNYIKYLPHSWYGRFKGWTPRRVWTCSHCCKGSLVHMMTYAWRYVWIWMVVKENVFYHSHPIIDSWESWNCSCTVLWTVSNKTHRLIVNINPFFHFLQLLIHIRAIWGPPQHVCIEHWFSKEIICYKLWSCALSLKSA